MIYRESSSPIFHTAIYILSSDCSNKPKWVEFAQDCLDKFVSLVPTMYYPELMVYNMHSLLHVSTNVLVHGSLDSYSAFEFENFMQTLKRLLRSKSCHLSQVVKRVGEINNFWVSENSFISDGHKMFQF
jgi:hypothetical protein